MTCNICGCDLGSGHGVQHKRWHDDQEATIQNLIATVAALMAVTDKEET